MNDNAMRRMDLDVFMLKSVILCSGRIIEDVNNIDVGQCNMVGIMGLWLCIGGCRYLTSQK